MIILQNKFICFRTKAFWMLLLNNHLYIFKTMCLFVGNEFSGSHLGFVRIPTLSRASIVGNMYNHMYPIFHLRRCLSLLAITRHIFSFSCKQPCDGTESTNQSPNMVLIHIMHSHPFHAMSPCIMKCDASLHVYTISHI